MRGWTALASFVRRTMRRESSANQRTFGVVSTSFVARCTVASQMVTAARRPALPVGSGACRTAS